MANQAYNPPMTLKELKEWKEYALGRIKNYYEQEIAHRKDILRLENEDKILQARHAIASIRKQSLPK